MFNLDSTSRGRTKGANAGRTRRAILEAVHDTIPGFRFNRKTIHEFISSRKLGISEKAVRKQLTLLVKAGIVYRSSKSPLEELGYEAKKRIRFPTYRINIWNVAELLIQDETDQFLSKFPASNKKQEETFKEAVKSSVIRQFSPEHDFSLKERGLEDFILSITELDRQRIIEHCMRAYDIWIESKKES